MSNIFKPIKRQYSNEQMPPPRPLTQADIDFRLKAFDQYMEEGWGRFKRALKVVMSGDAAYLFTYLVDQYKFHDAELKNNGWFFRAASDIHMDIYMCPRSQFRFLKELQVLGFVVIVRKGCRGVRHFWIDWQRVAAVWNNDVQTGVDKIMQLYGAKKGGELSDVVDLINEAEDGSE